MLGGGDRPPLLRSALLLSVGAPDQAQLEERVERLRESTAGSSCTGPAASSTGSSSPRCPPPASRCPTTRSTCCPSRSGRWCRTRSATPALEIGPYIGHTLSGSRAADPLRPRRGLPAQPAADLPARRRPRLRQDDLPRAAALAGLPAGLGPDRRHRPQGRPRPRPPARRRGDDRDDRALRRRALPRSARPDADRRRGDPRGPHLQLPDLDPAAAGQARVADPSALAISEAAAAQAPQLRGGPRPPRRLGKRAGQ